MGEATDAGGVDLRWNDPLTVLGGAHWWVGGDTGRRATLDQVVVDLDEAHATDCIRAHLGFLDGLLAAADGFREQLADGLGDAAQRPGAISPDAPLGRTCRQLAAALDGLVYELSRGLACRGLAPSAAAGRLVLDAAQVSVYLRSLTGDHRWALPVDEPRRS